MAHLSLHLLKCHIVGNHMSRLNILQTFIERIVLKTKCLNMAFQMFNPIVSSCIHVNIRLCDYPSFHWRHIILTAAFVFL